ncbi:MAG TPA: glycosyltransferase family A protein, partial [Candidatus Binataceae bacterium]|nr:glycosyltransferase family A protein [Candidatus Binataceae bacterium]
MPEVSVIIPTYNRWPMVSEAVASVVAQEGVDFELIVVDDGSTDETGERLHCWVQKLTTTHPFRIVRIPNRGPAAARNLGVKLANSAMIAFLDSDDLWQPGKLQRQVTYMRANPECGISQTEETWLRRGVRVNPGKRHLKRSGDLFFDSLRTCLVSPSAVIMRTDTFRAAGGFDEDLRAAEDYDLWLRLLIDLPVELLPAPLVIRRAGHPGQLSGTIPAIDRFRILALLKLLLREDLAGKNRWAVCDVLVEKCGIYGMGAARRGNLREAEFIARLAHLADA